MSGTLAALATVPGREMVLAQCLRSLRPQVDRLHVVCHDMTAPPQCVRELADEWICEPDTRGSAAKLHWARSHVGLYLGCDDDFHYPVNYVERMWHWVKRWKGKALVTCHGRIFTPHSRTFNHAAAFWPPRGANDGAWLTYPGGCAMAFDTRLEVPDVVPGKNLEEVHLAVWAQMRQVPIWLVPHKAEWLQYLMSEYKNIPTIWAAEKKDAFASRNAVMTEYLDAGHSWVTHTC